jgi:hypothetical protein
MKSACLVGLAVDARGVEELAEFVRPAKFDERARLHRAALALRENLVGGLATALDDAVRLPDVERQGAERVVFEGFDGNGEVGNLRPWRREELPQGRHYPSFGRDP